MRKLLPLTLAFVPAISSAQSFDFTFQPGLVIGMYTWCQDDLTGAIVPNCSIQAMTSNYPDPNSCGHTTAQHLKPAPSSRVSLGTNGPWTASVIYNTGAQGYRMVNFKAGQRDTYGTTDEKLVVAQPEAFVTCAVGGGCGKWDYAVGYTWPYGLNYMGEAPYWKLIGATIQHGNTNLVNHWLQQHANWGLWYAITNYLARNPDQGKVALNDQSLPCGGLFDISGRWQFPHRSHNLGLSADIRGNGGEYSLPRANNSAKQWEFVQLCIDRGGADPNQSTVEDIGTVNQHVHCRW